MSESDQSLALADPLMRHSTDKPGFLFIYAAVIPFAFKLTPYLVTNDNSNIPANNLRRRWDGNG